MIYFVLTPIFTRTDIPCGNGYFYKTEWKCIGTAKSLADAKLKFGGAPVLEVA